MKNTVYVLGNPLVTKDRLPFRLMRKLEITNPNFHFVLFDPTEDFIPKNNTHPVFLDTVIGIKKVTKFSDIENFSLSPRFSVHDFDLLLFIKLLKKLGKVKKITVIGVPEKGKIQEILKEVTSILKSI